MSFSKFSDLVKSAQDSAKYGLGYAVDSVARATSSALGSASVLAQSTSVQLSLCATLLAILPPPVAAAATAGATAFTLILQGQASDDDDASASSSGSTTPAEVGVCFTSLPPGLDLASLSRVFARDCLEGVVNGTKTVYEKMLGGSAVATETVNGITGTVTSNFGEGHQFGLNMTCARELLSDALNSVPLPSPPPAEATGDIDTTQSLFTIMAVAAGTLAVAHVAVDCRRHYLAEVDRAAAAGLVGGQDDPRVPLLNPADRRRSTSSGSGSINSSGDHLNSGRDEAIAAPALAVGGRLASGVAGQAPAAGQATAETESRGSVLHDL